ncbi:MAG: single-stranded DNA-binding protein [Chloroflexi bacterium]|nr:single-stranded DNA-binding protein [Chloroflexota bacterium]
MAGLNKVMIIGNVGTEPEMRYTADGNAMTSFRVATNFTFTSPDGERREETEWFSIITWRKLAEQCSQFLQKGRRVYVEGRLRTRSWDTPDGQRRFRTEVIANRVLFLDRAPGAPLPEEHEPETHAEAPAETPVEAPEEIPFEEGN